MLPQRNLGQSSSSPSVRTESTLSDFDRTLLETIRAEIPVPDQLRDPRKEFVQTRELKLSQKIGLLLFLVKCGARSKTNVTLRLQFLQEHASVEAIQAGMKFAEKLRITPKLRKDFKHCMFYYLATTPRTLEWHKRPKQRIRGYRDKGTLPDQSQRGRAKANEEGWFDMRGLEKQTVRQFLEEQLPAELIEGDFLDLPGAVEFLQEQELILGKLRKILLQL